MFILRYACVVVIAAVVAMASAGCSSSLIADSGDRVTISGSPRGIEALGDWLNGTARTAKETPEQNSEYFAHRANQERERSARKASATGFWQKLVN